MPRQLDVIPGLLRDPCPLDPSDFPRVDGGFDCVKCGHTVVDVAGLTLEEIVNLRRRIRERGERVCSAYTLDDEDRIILRAAAGSSAVIAVAVSVLLAACDPTPTKEPAHLAPSSAAVRSATVALSEPPPAPTASVEAARAPEVAASTKASQTDDTKGPGEPACPQAQSASTKQHSKRGRRALAGI